MSDAFLAEYIHRAILGGNSEGNAVLTLIDISAIFSGEILEDFLDEFMNEVFNTYLWEFSMEPLKKLLKTFLKEFVKYFSWKMFHTDVSDKLLWYFWGNPGSEGSERVN